MIQITNVSKTDFNHSNNGPIKLSVLRLTNLINQKMKYNIKKARQSVIKNELKCIIMAVK
jgi:hypothetical protein